jgi:hypothetical protein
MQSATREAGVGRGIALLVVVGILAFVVWSMSGLVRGLARDSKRRRAKPGSYEFDSRYNQVARKVKGVRGPSEDREGILAFIETRTGVEAYLEPKTVAYPLSVVLVAFDGEWKRFELAEDAFIRQLARETGLPTFDAARVGYPPRMREYKRPKPPDPQAPG